MKPFGKRILFKPKSEKAVLITKDPKLLEVGTVIAVGDEVTKVKEGDQIAFTPWGVDVLETAGEKHYFVMESDEFILAKVPVQE